MKVPVYNCAGETVEQIEISDSVFNIPLNGPVVHQALVRQLADARMGNADTKTRGEVEGSSRKMYAQKHTGRARRGNVRSPVNRHGGVVFGPHPRSYKQKLPKKMRQLALKGVLSSKMTAGELKIVDSFKLDEIKTKNAVRILRDLGIDNTALIITVGVNINLKLSVRNIPGIKVSNASVINVADLLSYKYLLADVTAISKIQQIWGAGDSAAQGSV